MVEVEINYIMFILYVWTLFEVDELVAYLWKVEKFILQACIIPVFNNADIIASVRYTISFELSK